MHVIVVGNPGVGKSLILNAIIGQRYFQSGVSLGNGLTKRLEVFRGTDGTHYVDTPGLDDVLGRDHSARELTRALSISGHCKLLFVCTLEDGRIRPSDMTTLRLILEAVRNSGANPNGRYSVIVNKVAESVLSQMEVYPRIRDDFILTFSTVAPVRHIDFFPMLDSASGVHDAQLYGDDAYRYRRFLDTAPLLLLPSARPAYVDGALFNDTRAGMSRSLLQTRETLDVLHRRSRNREMAGGAGLQEGSGERAAGRLYDPMSFMPSWEDVSLLARLFLGEDEHARNASPVQNQQQTTSSTEWYLRVIQLCIDVGIPIISRLLGYSSSSGSSSSPSPGAMPDSAPSLPRHPTGGESIGTGATFIARPNSPASSTTTD